ncbi:Delta2-dienoyl-CoA-isomerase [Dendrothele bispora CBS 962.96]|uniref:Delta2-dienoyl-CoA-isomerase n=1 Tax=Dendrothele bispora (strain CBS 962.96) TaxID=1314807 RepID=A0A4S8M991_DENBC|nr:Delta2-dienoyl-CoA-isomerase [Dendrothele bispora CBS 962.96]
MRNNTFSSKWLKVSEVAPYVIHVEIARGPVNAFNNELWHAYGTLFEKLADEGEDVRAVVVSSAFPKIFTAGLDLGDAGNLSQDTNSQSADPARIALNLQKHIKEIQHAIRTPERCPFPVIAAIHGMAVGIGVDLTSACDIRYAASNARFTIKEVDIGIAADVGTLAYLPKITGNMSLVRELAYTADWFSAAEAERLGFVSRVVEGGKDEVLAASLELAKKIASKSPVAVSGTKKLISHARDHSVEENLDYTVIWNSATLQTKDMAESIAANRGKRVGQFGGLLTKSKL